MNDYNVDLVLCIDATGSMGPIIEEVKTNAVNLYEMFRDSMEENNKNVSELRVKVIAFRDYGYDNADPMVISEFFKLPDEDVAFKNFVQGIEATRGGDIPENALEALALALKSDFTTGGEKRRHVIVLFTDAPALPLSERTSFPGYPEGMPASFAELGEWWENGLSAQGGTYQPTAGRLVVFAPDAEPWNQMQAWNRVWFTPSAAGAGLSEVDMASAVDILVGSVSATVEQ